MIRVEKNGRLNDCGRQGTGKEPFTGEHGTGGKKESLEIVYRSDLPFLPPLGGRIGPFSRECAVQPRNGTVVGAYFGCAG
jgi:hypothetical protein